jgi:hypothetical protein
MRRCSAVLLLLVLAAVAGLRLSASATDTEAMRCAIACGHAAGAVNGAACCPMANAPGAGPMFKACAPEGGSAMTPLASGQLLFLASAVRLVPPDSVRDLNAPAASGTLVSTPRPVDHVPLLLG